MQATGRLFLCARCRAQVFICRRCDRGTSPTPPGQMQIRDASPFTRVPRE